MMEKQKIYKIVVALRLRLNTIRDNIARMNFRLALRFPQKLKLFGDPRWIILTAIVTCVAIALGMESCTAVRTYTTTATYETRGDSVACIWTKTQEQYKGKKDNR